MRTLLVVVVLLVLMVVGGWVVFSYKAGTASVEFRSDEAKKDVEKVIDDTGTLIDNMRNRTPDPTTTIQDGPIVPEHLSPENGSPERVSPEAVSPTPFNPNQIN